MKSLASSTTLEAKFEAWSGSLLLLALILVAGLLVGLGMFGGLVLQGGDFCVRLMDHLMTPMGDWRAALYLDHPIGCGLSLFHRLLFAVFSPETSTSAAMIGRLAGLAVFLGGVLCWGLGTARLFDRSAGLIMAALTLMGPLTLAYAMQAATEPMTLGLPGMGFLAWVVYLQQRRLRYLFLCATIFLLASMVRQEMIFMAFGLWLVAIPVARWWAIPFGLVATAYAIPKTLYTLITIWSGRPNYAGRLLVDSPYRFGDGSVLLDRMATRFYVEYSVMLWACMVMIGVSVVGLVLFRRKANASIAPNPISSKVRVASVVLPLLASAAFLTIMLLSSKLPDQPRYTVVLIPWLAATTVGLCWLCQRARSAYSRQWSSSLALVAMVVLLGVWTVPSFVHRMYSAGPRNGDPRLLDPSPIVELVAMLNSNDMTPNDVAIDLSAATRLGSEASRIMVIGAEMKASWYGFPFLRSRMAYPFERHEMARIINASDNEALTTETGDLHWLLASGKVQGLLTPPRHHYEQARSKYLVNGRFVHARYRPSHIWPFLDADGGEASTMILRSPALPWSNDTVVLRQLDSTDMAVLWDVEVDAGLVHHRALLRQSGGATIEPSLDGDALLLTLPPGGGVSIGVDWPLPKGMRVSATLIAEVDGAQVQHTLLSWNGSSRERTSEQGASTAGLLNSTLKLTFKSEHDDVRSLLVNRTQKICQLRIKKWALRVQGPLGESTTWTARSLLEHGRVLLQ